MGSLVEKRVVKRYWIRPQNIACGNKKEIIDVLIDAYNNHQNCTVYTMLHLPEDEREDTSKLTNKDIIYTFDSSGLLKDKNGVPVFDYDLMIKHEEKRDSIDPDSVSDSKFADVYDDRMTDLTVVEDLNELNLDFDDINVYGEKLREGKEVDGICCICGEPIVGYGNNAEPYAEGRCCDSCNAHFVIPYRLEQANYKNESLKESLFTTSPDFDMNMCLPTEEDLKKAIERRNDYYANGKNARFDSNPYRLAASTSKVNKIIKHMIVGHLIDFPEMEQAHKEKLIKNNLVDVDDIKLVIQELQNHADKYEAMLGELLTESLNEGMSREAIIAEMKKLGYNYKFDKYTDQQLYRIYQKSLKNKQPAEKKTKKSEYVPIKYCDKCGTALTDGGECPLCDLGDESVLDEGTKKIKDHKWVNKGKAGSHGNFTTKKAADAQRRAMFANGFHESLITEDIEKHDELNPKLWNEDETIKPEVKEKINQIVDEFISRLEDQEIKFNLKDIIIVGSNCSYNYSKNSDLDLHIVAETDSLNCPDNLYPKLYSAYRSLFNKNIDIDFYGIPVEVYVQTEETPMTSNGIYSVMNDAWIKEPVQEDIPEIDKEAFDKEFKVWEDRYNEIIDGEDLKESKLNEVLRNISKMEIIVSILNYITGKDYSYLLDKTPSKQGQKAVAKYEIHHLDADHENNILDNLFILNRQDHQLYHSGKISFDDVEKIDLGNVIKQFLKDNPETTVESLIDGANKKTKRSFDNSTEYLNEEIANGQLEEIDALIQDIYDLRKSSIAEGGEYSLGNLLFKNFRDKGYLDNLKDLKNELIGKELSLESLEKLTVNEHLEEKQRYDYKDELSRIAFNQAIVNDNGLFHIYNIKESDVDRILYQIRNLNYIDWVQKSAGRFDFSKVGMPGSLQPRIYEIYGQIRED